MSDDYMFYVDLDIACESDVDPVSEGRSLGGDYTELLYAGSNGSYPVVRVWTYSYSMMIAVLEDYHLGCEEEVEYWKENYVKKGELNVSNINSLD